MKISDIKEQIKIALDSVKELDEPYKLETFKIILSKSLKSPNQSEKVTQIQNNDESMLKNEESTDLNSGMKQLSNLCKIDERELFDILKIENDEITLKKILSGTEKQQQIVAAQLILLGYEFGLGITEVDSLTLKKVLKKSHIHDKSSHLSKYLKNEKNLFSMSSKGGGRNTYSLTANQGRTSAIDLITKLVRGEDHD